MGEPQDASGRVSSSNGVNTKGQLSSEWVLLAVMTGLGLYLSWRILLPFVTVIAWSAVVALVFMPVQRWLLRRGARPSLAAAATLLLALVVVLLPVSLLSVAVAAEVGDLVAKAPELWNRVVEDPARQARLAAIHRDLSERFPFLAGYDAERIKASLTQTGEAAMQRSVGAIGRVFGGMVRFVLIAFSLFFFLRDGKEFERSLRNLLPLSAHKSDRLIERTAEVIQASVFGVIVVALVQGTLGGIIFLVLGLPSPVLWAVLMALFAMVPVLGAGAVWLPGSLVLFAMGQPGKAAILFFFGLLVISTIDNVLRPWLVGKRTGLHALVVFFAVLGGLQLFGVVGLLLGPATLAVSWALLDLFRNSSSDSTETEGRLGS